MAFTALRAAALLALSAAVFAHAWALPVRAADARLDWHSLALVDITGQPVPGDTFAGRVVLLVNTASRCAFTGQYADLEALWERYRGMGLVVLGVPSNDFGGQEPGSNSDIAAFCSSTYGVSFPMLEKSPVTGAGAHPLFAFARESAGRSAVPGWNFHKIVIGREGRVVDAFPSFVKPSSAQVIRSLERALRTPAL